MIGSGISHSAGSPPSEALSPFIIEQKSILHSRNQGMKKAGLDSIRRTSTSGLDMISRSQRVLAGEYFYGGCLLLNIYDYRIS
jgi:hypothetical protein